MKEIIYNIDNLKEEDITETVIRIKTILISNDYLLIGNESEGVYQFIGGHLEDGESFNDCLKREVLEEVGIEISDDEISGPIMSISYLNKDWPAVGKNRKAIIYYYVVKTNKDIDLSRTNYTDEEKYHNFKIEKFKLDEAISKIKDNISINEKNKIISYDMISALEEYFKVGV